jgi:hypothetical protein
MLECHKFMEGGAITLFKFESIKVTSRSYGYFFWFTIFLQMEGEDFSDYVNSKTSLIILTTLGQTYPMFAAIQGQQSFSTGSAGGRSKKAQTH